MENKNKKNNKCNETENKNEKITKKRKKNTKLDNIIKEDALLKSIRVNYIFYITCIISLYTISIYSNTSFLLYATMAMCPYVNPFTGLYAWKM